MANDDDDDDRDERDSDAPEEEEEKKVEKKPEKKPAKVAKPSAPATLDDVVAELARIEKLVQEAKEQHYPHLWLLFPIAAAVLIQAIFSAMRL